MKKILLFFTLSFALISLSAINVKASDTITFNLTYTNWVADISGLSDAEIDYIVFNLDTTISLEVDGYNIIEDAYFVDESMSFHFEQMEINEIIQTMSAIKCQNNFNVINMYTYDIDAQLAVNDEGFAYLGEQEAFAAVGSLTLIMPAMPTEQQTFLAAIWTVITSVIVGAIGILTIIFADSGVIAIFYDAGLTMIGTLLLVGFSIMLTFFGFRYALKLIRLKR